MKNREKKGKSRMKSNELVKKHGEICIFLNEVYEKKNKDYGNSFEETYKRLGIISAVTRIADKMSRLESLATKPEEERLVKDESIKDTVLDMANYCIMLAMELERESDERKAISNIQSSPSQGETPLDDLIYRKSNGGTINFPDVSTLPLTSIPAVFFGD